MKVIKESRKPDSVEEYPSSNKYSKQEEMTFRLPTKSKAKITDPRLKEYATQGQQQKIIYRYKKKHNYR